MTFAFVRTFLATDFFVFALARGLGVLVLLPEPGFEGVDFLATCPPLGMASFIGRVDVVAFDAERDTAFFFVGDVGLRVTGFFLGLCHRRFFGWHFDFVSLYPNWGHSRASRVSYQNSSGKTIQGSEVFMHCCFRETSI